MEPNKRDSESKGPISELSCDSDESFIETHIPMRINKKISSIRYNLNKQLKKINYKL